MNRSEWVRAVVVLAVTGAVVLGAGCDGSGHPRTLPDPGTNSSSPPKLDVVLNDGGLQLSSTSIRAGVYRVSFRDERSHPPAGEVVAVAFGASGPRYALATVPAGSAHEATLLQNDIVWVTVNGVPNYSPGGDSLAVEPTPQFPTPVT